MSNRDLASKKETRRFPFLRVFENSLFITVLKLVSLLVAVIVFYFSDLQILVAEAWENQGFIVIALVLSLVVFVVYRKRRMISAVALSSSVAPIDSQSTLSYGAGLGIVVFALYFCGSQTSFSLLVHLGTLPLFVAAAVLVLFNVQTLRQVLFPVVALFFLISPALLFSIVGQSMIDVYGQILSSIVLLVLLLMVVLKVRFFSGVLKRTRSEDSSWAIFNVHFRTFGWTPVQRSHVRRKVINISTISLVIVLSLLGAFFFASFPFAASQRSLPVLEDKTGGQVGNLSLLPSIKHYTVQFLGQDIQAEHDTGENFSLSYEFVSQSQSAVDVTLNLEIADYSWALTSWDSLLDSQTSNSQKGAVLLDQRNVTLPESSGVEATYFAYRDKLSGQSQVVLYWIQSSLFEVGNSTREEHVEASLIVPIDNDSAVSVAEARLLPFASAVTEYWDTKVSISSILSLLPIIDVSLLAGSLGVVLFLLVLSLVKRKSIYRANERAFQKLSGVSKHVLSLIGHLSKRRAPTFEEVFDSSKSISEFSGDKELLLQEVLMLEKMGLVERQVDCDHDAPILTWKIKIHNRLVNGEGKNFSLNFGRGGSK